MLTDKAQVNAATITDILKMHYTTMLTHYIFKLQTCITSASDSQIQGINYYLNYKLANLFNYLLPVILKSTERQVNYI